MGAIEWLNHAGFAVRSDSGSCLVVDPWFDGEVFDRSWALQSPTVTSIDDLADCRHVWISHEHPDHFSPAALRAFPEEQRRRMTVWYQETRDGRVLRFCESLGFRVRTMPDGQPVAMADGITATCGKVGSDSWLHLTVDGRTLLDLNDCEFAIEGELEGIAARLGPVDVLLQQFSYANGMTNPENGAGRVAQAADKLDRLATSIGLLDPEVVVPCASFVWFCHEENDFLNDSVVTIDRAADHVEALGRRAVVLHPGDVWEIGAAHDSGPALTRYAEDARRNAGAPRRRSEAVDDAALLAASAAAQVRIRAKNQLWAIRPFRRTRYLKPVVIRVTDSPTEVFTYDMFGGLRPAEADAEADIALAGESLLFCLEHEYGTNTLMVNGRFTEERHGGLLRFRLQFSPSMRNNHGQSLPGVFLDRRFLLIEARKLLTERRRTLARR